MDTDTRLKAIEARLDNIERDVGLAVNYMRALAQIVGAQARLAEVDREMSDVERRDTDGETQS